jgi:ABC-type amino acid transport substrate-binding protein
MLEAFRPVRAVFISAAAILILFLAFGLSAEARTLKVGVWNAPPYASTDQKGDVSGMSVQVWNAIATEVGIDYEIVICKNITEILDRISAGTLDASIGPTATTSERAKKVMFSQPYYYSGMGILVPVHAPTMWERMKPFLTTAVLTAVISLVLMLTAVGYIIWIFERHSNPEEFSKHWYTGIGSGMWLALSALTTVGFGDVVPKTRGGRIVCGVWMVLSMIIATSFTAGLASMLTTALTADYVKTQGIVTPEQLRGKTVAVLKGTNLDQAVHHHGGRVIYRDNLPDAIRCLLGGECDAVGCDRVSLLYYLLQHPNNKVKVPSMSIFQENIAFAFSFSESELLNRFNVSLLRLQEAGTVDMINDSWLNTLRNSPELSNQLQSPSPDSKNIQIRR